MSPVRSIAVAVALITQTLSPTQAAEPVFPPGARVGLTPPDGMTVSQSFQGFEDQARRAAIIITELSAQTFPKILQEFTPEKMKADGLDVLTREEIALPRGVGLLVAARQQSRPRWALVTSTSDIAAIVMVTMAPEAIEHYSDMAVRAALASVVVRAKPPDADMLGALPYRLSNLGGFQLLRTNPDGTAVLTFGPRETTLPAEQPYFIITLKPGAMPQLSERESFAQRILLQFVGLGDFRQASSSSLQLGGQPGHEIVGDTKDPKDGTAYKVVQWLRFGAGGYMQMFGIARSDAWDETLPRMRAMRDSIQRR